MLMITGVDHRWLSMTSSRFEAIPWPEKARLNFAIVYAL